ncbi:YeeE/YedE thiosulfate transporter family protein [Amycolatopsis sp. NPDC051758]|uniref:YeeE/YedE thiosulfate transporter family protein n=1 Tax=Amycolatopsis sp. NPDC051758 TaxID=3363935 RepID=UPI0037A4FD68
MVRPKGWALLAGIGGASFGPSTVGAVAGLAAGEPNWWLTAFLPGTVPGAAIAARLTGDLHIRGGRPVRYARLVVGGFLLGEGGWLAGGCNLGHGLSGVAQLNVSSWVVVAAIIGGIALARATRGVVTGPPEHR